MDKIVKRSDKFMGFGSIKSIASIFAIKVNSRHSRGRLAQWKTVRFVIFSSSDRGSNLAIRQVFFRSQMHYIPDSKASKYVGKNLATSQPCKSELKKTQKKHCHQSPNL